jgi:hypothetical protein
VENQDRGNISMSKNVKKELCGLWLAVNLDKEGSIEIPFEDLFKLRTDRFRKNYLSSNIFKIRVFSDFFEKDIHHVINLCELDFLRNNFKFEDITSTKFYFMLHEDFNVEVRNLSFRMELIAKFHQWKADIEFGHEPYDTSKMIQIH